jgi:hypothetical protein
MHLEDEVRWRRIRQSDEQRDGGAEAATGLCRVKAGGKPALRTLVIDMGKSSPELALARRILELQRADRNGIRERTGKPGLNIAREEGVLGPGTRGR